MSPSKSGKPAKKTSGAKKEKVFHPSSRKAGQLVRKSLRKEKLQNLATKRQHKQGTLVDIYGFFYHSMPDEGVLNLGEMHEIIRDVWLTRHDEELAAEKASRRKGRPKSRREIELEEIKLQETEQYRTGMEVIDLTHAPTVELFRLWDQKEYSYIDLLRFIRVFSTELDHFVVSRPGKHVSITKSSDQDDSMDIEEQNQTLKLQSKPIDSTFIPILQESPQRFASNITTMDEVPVK